MKKAVIYARYSSEKQNEQSIEGQLRVCEDYAQRNELKIVKTFIDRAQSGTNDNRTSFQKMLHESVDEQWDYILVYKLDRFSRNKYEMAVHRKFLKDHGIKILSAMENIPDTPEGIILESLLEGMAEYYSAELSQKVKRGNHENRLKGLYTGGYIPLGYKVINKKLYIDEKTAPYIIKMYEDYLAGKTLQEIINTLNSAGLTSGHAAKFTKSTIYNMLHNEKYIGITRYNDEVYTNIYPQLIPTSLYKAVQEHAEIFKYGKRPKNIEDLYLLRQKVVCGQCGQNYISEAGAGSNKIVRRYYKCCKRKRDNSCKNVILRKEEFEQIIVDATFKIFEKSEEFSDIVNRIYTLHRQRSTSGGLLDLLLSQKELITSSINNLLKYIEQGMMVEETNQRIQELKTQLKDIENQIQELEDKSNTKITKEDISKFLRTTLKQEPYAIMQLLVQKVVIYPTKIDIFYNYVENELRPKTKQEPIKLHTEHHDYLTNKGRLNTPPKVVDIEINGYM